jgi:hypothetical protein
MGVYFEFFFNQGNLKKYTLLGLWYRTKLNKKKPILTIGGQI